MRLDFRLHDASGSVEVSVEPNKNPGSLGKPPFAKDFPVCTATVSYAGEGYRAAMGWVQLVRSTDGAGAWKKFEMDPFEPLGPSTHPLCFFGFAPVLFDAPARPSREDRLERAADEHDLTQEATRAAIAPASDELQTELGRLQPMFAD